MSTMLSADDAATVRLLSDEQFAQARTAGERAWAQQRNAEPTASSTSSREQQVEAERRLERFAREHAALQTWSAREPDDRTQPSVVIAHRHPWTSRSLTERLLDAGWVVHDVEGEAAEAVGALVAVQPSVLLCSDRVLSSTGVELVERTASLAPYTLRVVQVDQDGRTELMRRSGAHVVVSHRTSALDLAAALESLRAG